MAFIQLINSRAMSTHFIVIGDQFVGPLTLFRPKSITVLEIPNLIASTPPADLAKQVQKLVSDRVSSFPQDNVIVLFVAGNVDVQIEIYRQAIFHPNALSAGVPEASTIESDFSRYALRGVYRWCRWIRDLKLTVPVIVGSAFLPTVAESYMAASLIQYLGCKKRPIRASAVNQWVTDHPEFITVDARMAFIQLWNNFLKVACTDLLYIDLNEEFLEDGAIAKAYRHPTWINHTLVWESTLDIWQGRLDLTDEDLIEPRSEKYIKRKIAQLKQL